MPELKTSNASAPRSSTTGPRSTGSGVVVSSRERAGTEGRAAARASRPPRSPTTALGDTTAHACCTSVAFHAGLNITMAAPSWNAPYTANTNSGRLADISAMRVPWVTPTAARRVAHWSAWVCTSANV